MLVLNACFVTNGSRGNLQKHRLSQYACSALHQFQGKTELKIEIDPCKELVLRIRHFNDLSQQAFS